MLFGPHRWIVALLSLTLLLPAGLAGHAVVDVNPCAGNDGAAALSIPGCRGTTPIPGCWRERDGRAGGYDASLCGAADADASCVAFATRVALPPLLFSEESRVDAAVRGYATARGDASQQEAATPVLTEATLPTDCLASTEKCVSNANAEVVNVNLLGGLITAEALEAHVALGCVPFVQETRFTNLVIAGQQQDPLMHPGSSILIPGVAWVRVGLTDAYWTPSGAYGVSATSLRVDLLDTNGNPTGGVILVGHAAATLRV